MCQCLVVVWFDVLLVVWLFGCVDKWRLVFQPAWVFHPASADSVAPRLPDVGVWLLDASKRGVSTQPQLSVAPRLPDVGVWLLDASKRGVSTQPQLSVAPRLPDVGVWLLDASKRGVSTQAQLSVAPRLPDVGVWLLDASKRGVSTQPQLTVLPHAYRMLVWIAVLTSTSLSCGMVVLLVRTGCRLFHSLMVLGNNVVWNASVRA